MTKRNETETPVELPPLAPANTYAYVPANPYDSNVQRGAAFLDRIAPGWEAYIDLATLNLADCLYCVFGQLVTNTVVRHAGPPSGFETICFKCYHGVKRFYELSSHDVLNMGFTTAQGNFPVLTDAWKAEILRRRGA
jgi:hypothetical protein